MVEMRNSYQTVGKPEENNSFGRTKYRWEDVAKHILKE
jgi:hypothetical protein